MALRRQIPMALFALAAADVPAVTIVYQGTLSGSNESPPVTSAGIGKVVLTYSTVNYMLRVQTSFSGLGAGATVAHIHCCTSAGQLTASVATMTPSFSGFPAGVTAGTYDQTFDMSLASSYNAAFITANGGTASAALGVLLAGIANGTAYFNIHTTDHPAGEIRAPIVVDTIFGDGFD